MSEAAIHNEASLLMAHPVITMRVETLQKAKDRAVVASAVSDKELVLTELRRHVKEADTDSNKLRAIEILGRTVPGLFKGEAPAAPERTAEEIRAELAEYLAEIDNQVH